MSMYAPNHALYTYSGLGAAFEAANVDGSILLNIPAFIQSLVGGASLNAFLLSGGCDFSLAAVQAQLSANLSGASAIDTVAINAMIGLGGTSGTLWQQFAVSQPQLSDITAALANNVVQQQITLFCNNTWNVLVGTGTATVAQLKSAVDDWNP